VFHPAWIDNRTGVPQVWTAPVRVIPATQAGLDLSSKLAVEVSDAVYDPKSRTVTVVSRLHNTSSETLRGPFTARVIAVDSELGDPDASGNNWTFSDLALAPGAVSRPVRWQFVLANPQPYRNGNRYRLGLVKMRFSVTGAAGH
jgi:hypothetical protein